MVGTSHPEFWAALAAPFEQDEVKEREGAKGEMFKYVSARTVMNRLDDVAGPENWWDEFVPNEESVICRLSIRLPDQTVVTKVDAGGFADMKDLGDSDKSGFSDAFKRAAVKFGIGRYLYRDGVPKFVREQKAREIVSAVAQTPRNGPPAAKTLPEPTVTQAPEQENIPEDMGIRPKAGTAQVYSWVYRVGKHFGVDLVTPARNLAKRDGLSTDWKLWSPSQVEDIVERIQTYCKKLPAYKGEFDEPPSGQAELDAAKTSCSMWASILWLRTHPGVDLSENDPKLYAFIKENSDGMINDYATCISVPAVQAATDAIKKKIDEFDAAHPLTQGGRPLSMV